MAITSHLTQSVSKLFSRVLGIIKCKDIKSGGVLKSEGENAKEIRGVKNSQLEQLLHSFYGANITTLNSDKNVVVIEYELNGEVKRLYTTPHCLLAGITTYHRRFKIPLGIQKFKKNQDLDQSKPHVNFGGIREVEQSESPVFNDIILMSTSHPNYVSKANGCICSLNTN